MRSLLGSILNKAPAYVSNGRISIPWKQPAGAEQQMAAMGSVGTLFAIVNSLSTAVSKAEWHLYRTAASGRPEDREEVTAHPAVDLWAQPNPFMSDQEFVETIQQHVELTGEGWSIVGRNPRSPLPLELWPVRPDFMAPVPDPESFISGYTFTDPNGRETPYGLDEVLRQRMPNPLDMYRGMGPVQSILTELDSVRYSAEWNRNFFRNSAEPGGIIEVEKSLSDDEFDEMSARWDEQHKGVANAHRVAIIEQGKWVNRTFTMRDMQFAELRTLGRDVLMEAFAISKTALGISDDVNRAVALAAKAVHGENLLVPRLDRWKGMRDRSLKLYGPTGEGLEWDYDSPVPTDEEAENAERLSKSQAAQSYVAAGFTGESVVEALGLPKVLVWEKPTAPVPPPAPAPPRPVEPARAPAARHIHRPRNAPPLGTPPEGWPAFDPDTVDAIDLTPVQAAWEKALAALLVTWQTSIIADWIGQLVDAIRAAITGGDTAALTALTVDPTAAADELAAALTVYAETAAGHAADEAAEQGITLTPTWPTADDLTAAADQIAQFEAQRVALAAGREAARVAGPEPDADVVAEHVEAFLGELSDAGAEQALGSALTDAQNQARQQTFQSGPVGALYASEQMDRNTCLAPDALVTTRRGEVRADEVALDDELLTHAGRWVPPSQIIISEVDEDLVVADLGNGRQLRVTDDHPVLVVEGDVLVWREAGQLTVGALMVGQASLENSGELVVPDLYLGQAPHDVAAVGQVGGLPPVDVRPEAVPVAAVGLDDQLLTDEEVHDPRSDLRLRGEAHVVGFEAKSDGALQARLQATRHVAARRTVAAILRPGWDRTEVGAALFAGDVDGRPSAGLGAVGAHGGLAVSERSAAASAGGVAPAGSAGADARAVVEPVDVDHRDVEGDRAVRADLLNSVEPAELRAEVRVAVPAGVRAVDGTCLVASCDLVAADLAEAGRNSKSPALKSGVLLATHSFENPYVAIDTRLVHKLSVVEVVALQRKRHAGRVYDFTVSGDETFWTEGVLVHNCSPCREIHGRWICNTDDQTALYALYPTGGYIDCKGRWRCRGTQVGVWRPKTTVRKGGQ